MTMETSSWDIGMTKMHGIIRATAPRDHLNEHWAGSTRSAFGQPPLNYLATYPELAPLGSKDAILGFIRTRLAEAVVMFGPLPVLREVPVPGCNQPLLVPSVGLPEDLDVDGLAARGLDGLTTLVRSIDAQVPRSRAEVDRAKARAEAEQRRIAEDWNEEEREAIAHAGTAEGERNLKTRTARLDRTVGVMQSITATAVLLSSVADAVNSMPADGTPVEIAVAVLNITAACADALNSVCTALSVIGALSSAMAIVGIVLEVLAWLIRFIVWLIEYFDHYHADPATEGWDKDWDEGALRAILGERLRSLCFCEELVHGPSGEPIAPLSPANMNAVFAENGVSGWKGTLRWMLETTSLHPPEGQGPNWIAHATTLCRYFGGSAEAMAKLDDIRQWLLFAGVKAEFAEVVWWWLYESLKVTTVVDRQLFITTDARRCQDHGRNPVAGCDLVVGTENPWLGSGSPTWYSERQYLPISLWDEFRLDDLRFIHHQVRAYFVLPPTTLTLAAGGVSLAPQFAGNPTLDVIQPDVVVDLRSFRVLCYRGLTEAGVRVERRANFTGLLAGDGTWWGCLVTDRAAYLRDLLPSPHAPNAPAVLRTGEAYTRVAYGYPTYTQENRRNPAGVVVPVWRQTGFVPDRVAEINSERFLDELDLALRQALGGGTPISGAGLAVGTVLLGGLSYLSYLLLPRA